MSLLLKNVKVAIVTAAGYQNDNLAYEKRIKGLIDEFKEKNLKIYENFYVLGGECNYLFRYDPLIQHLIYINQDDYIPDFVQAWSLNTAELHEFLDITQKHLETQICEMGLSQRVKLLRKSRAIGVLPISGFNLCREQLNEFALGVQQKLGEYQSTKEIKIPFCAFNGGSDVWVDVGNKLIGVKILQKYLECSAKDTLHVGDQFLSTGNDIATRTACCTIWITSPQETVEILKELSDRI